MMLPLLCASLLVAGLCAPAAVPYVENEDVKNTFVHRKSLVVFGGDSVTSFDGISDDTMGSITLKFPYGVYYNTHGASFTVDISSEISFGLLTIPVGSQFYELESVDDPLFEDDYFSCEFSLWYESDLLTATNYSVAFYIGNNEFPILGDISTIFYNGTFGISYDGNNVITVPVGSVDGVEVVNEIVSILGAGVGSLGAAIGAGVASFAESLAFDGEGNLSVYFIMVIALCGVSLSIALTTRLFGWLTSLGN